MGSRPHCAPRRLRSAGRQAMRRNWSTEIVCKTDQFLRGEYREREVQAVTAELRFDQVVDVEVFEAPKGYYDDSEDDADKSEVI